MEDGHNVVVYRLVDKLDLHSVRVIVRTRKSRAFNFAAAIMILCLLGQVAWTQPIDTISVPNF